MKLTELFKAIKQYRFNLRLSLNVTSELIVDYNELTMLQIFQVLKVYNVDQVTFRKMYNQGDNEWLSNHSAPETFFRDLNKFIMDYGKALEKLEYGYTKYSIEGIGTVVDTDCMSTESSEDLKYLILRPNCKLYSRWDDKGSLIF
jgi:hypothetical protein